MKDKAYYEDWCCYAFKDLALSQYFFANEDSTQPFNLYKTLYCFQSIEKILKALLIKKNKIAENSELRKYGHNFNKLLGALNLAKVQRNKIYKEFSRIGDEFYYGLGEQRSIVNLDDASHFDLKGIREYGKGLKYFSLYLYILSGSYEGVRYPECYKSSKPYSVNLDESIYVNKEIFIATIRTFKVIENCLGVSADKYLWLNYTWDAQMNDYDCPSDETIDTFMLMEELLKFILNKRKTVTIGIFKITNKAYYVNGVLRFDLRDF